MDDRMRQKKKGYFALLRVCIRCIKLNHIKQDPLMDVFDLNSTINHILHIKRF